MRENMPWTALSLVLEQGRTGNHLMTADSKELDASKTKTFLPVVQMHLSPPITFDFPAKRHVRLKMFTLLDISAASGLSCDKLGFVFVFSAC